MTRFKKEMAERLHVRFDVNEDGETSACTIEEKAFVVLCHPSMTIVLHVLQNGVVEDVTDDNPRISAPLLVHLCGGNEEEAKRIIMENKF